MTDTMVYDQELAARLRKLLPTATEKTMFGGVGLMERGHMIAGVSHNDLVVRVPPAETTRWLQAPGAHPMMPGRPMQGWVKVAGAGLSDVNLRSWVERSRRAVAELPPK